jgi:glycerophosphoryl diester phosphodiesterase
MNTSHASLPADLQVGRHRPLILAHRGCRALLPENSIPAFQLALEQGADIIETDLRITQDRVIVCIHDATVDRTTEGRGRVDQMNWDDLRCLRLKGFGRAGQSGAGVPSLAEVLERFSQRAYLALELKGPGFTEPEDVDLLLHTLHEHDAMDRVLALSFSRKALGCVARSGASIPLGLISALNPWPAADYPLVGPWWPLLLINPFYVTVSHRRGQFCCPLDPCPERRLRFYLWLGVDALLSDNPALTIKNLGALGKHRRGSG